MSFVRKNNIYKNFSYIYPPRPEFKISADQLIKYDKDYLIQPKLNGSCALIFIKGGEIRNFGRHKNENLSNFKLTNEDLKILNCNNDNWNVIVGEYMNKNKKGLDGKHWNHKFVIFDILVYNDKYLVGTTYSERIQLLDDIFGVVDENEYLYKITDKIFRVKTFYDNFLERWNNIIKIDMLEGFVLKKMKQKLEVGIREKNNLQIKCRKPTKNYHF